MAINKDEGYERAKKLPTGSRHYRAFIGPVEIYDQIAAMQFNILTYLGLREHHSLLDIGCGSLRAGKLFIPYLRPRRYFGIEPEKWLVEEGIEKELGKDIIGIKKPAFDYNRNYNLSVFDTEFDYLVAQSIFSHAPSCQISKCFNEAAKVMKTTSIFTATYVKGDSNHTGDKWLYPDVTHFTPDYMQKLVENEGLKCESINWPHPTSQQWILVSHPENHQMIRNLCDKALKDTKFDYEIMKNELNMSNKRINELESHPLIKMGMKINRYLNR